MLRQKNKQNQKILLNIHCCIYKINIKNKTAGSILQKKIVGVFSAIAITPVLIVAIFAVIFFERGIQGWFSKRVSTALEKSAAIAENYTQELRKRVEGDVLFASLRLSQINEINYNDLIYSISKAKSPSCLSEIRIPIEFTL